MKRVVLIVLLLLLLISGLAVGEEDFFTDNDQYNNLRLGNDYVVIVTNTDENGQGRFAIETTGGAPFRSNDDNKPLVYGRPIPWTSYTTLWLDDEYFVFGGKTGRRAGRDAQYGTVIQAPKLKDNSISTITRFANSIEVEQLLTIVKSTTTGLYDSVEIKYIAKNTSNQEHKIGLRVMLDTMLGQNDGAPFRFGKDAVTADKVYYQKQLPEFWQAFDSLSQPNVTSQGTFTGREDAPPDKVNLADWGSLADGTWNFDFNPGEEFLRKGEFEIDSAIAMYWVPQNLAAGESKVYATYYGLGGITIVPGLLSLGVTSPAEITFDTPEKTFPIIAYIENTSEITANNVRISLDIDDSLQVDNKTKNLGNIESGGIAQVVWNVKVSGQDIAEKINYQVKVDADNTDSNQVNREIRFIGPPNLETEVFLKKQPIIVKGKLNPNPFMIEAIIRNTGASTLKNVTAELILPPGLFEASREKLKRYTGDIRPGESLNITWQVKAGEVEGIFPFALDVRALHGYRINKTYQDLKLPELQPLLYLDLVDHGGLEEGDYIRIYINGENIRSEINGKIETLKFSLNYNPEYLKLIYVQPGNFFVKGGNTLPWSQPEIEQAGVLTFKETLPVDKSSGTLTSIFFRVEKLGDHSIKWSNTEFLTNQGEQIGVELKTYNFN